MDFTHNVSNLQIPVLDPFEETEGETDQRQEVIQQGRCWCWCHTPCSTQIRVCYFWSIWVALCFTSAAVGLHLCKNVCYTPETLMCEKTQLQCPDASFYLIGAGSSGFLFAVVAACVSNLSEWWNRNRQ